MTETIPTNIESSFTYNQNNPLTLDLPLALMNVLVITHPLPFIALLTEQKLPRN